MTRRLRTLLAGILAVAVLGLAGCQDGDDPESSPTGPATGPATNPATNPATTGTSQATEPSAATSAPSNATSSPAVAVATGPELRLESSSVQAPEGWEKLDPIADYESSASRPGGGGLITLIDFDGLGGERTLDGIYRATVESLPPNAQPTRQPDALLGEEQHPAVFVTFTVPGDDNTHAMVVASRAGRSITLEFRLKPSDLQEDPDLVASVLASFEWV